MALIDPLNVTISDTIGEQPGGANPPPTPGPTILTPRYDTYRLLDIFNVLKRESTEYRWIWEREWLRDLYYVVNRQWIFFHPTRREWVDKRLQKWIPRPVTNKMAETVQAIRTNLAAINLAVKVRPVGNDPQSIAAAQIADELGPLLHEEHRMQQVMREADFWLITTGNACLQLSWDRDIRFNQAFVAFEQCLACQQVWNPKDIVAAGHRCPNCGGTAFQPATHPDGSPVGEVVGFGRGKTTALSPFEYAFPPNITNFHDLPYIIRLRWRDKHYYEANHPEIIGKVRWEKSPTDRSLQIFKSLALTNDVGTGSQFAYLGTAGAHTVEGITEYELWMKPTKEFPQGLVLRVAGDTNPVLVDAPEEGIPGPIPYTDITGKPLFPFCHAQYEHLGGRLYGRSAIAPLIQKQDQLNQLDSLIQLCVQRTANPAWVVPEDAGIENLTGEPGLIIKWRPLAAQGHGEPKRIPGENIPQSLFLYRQQLLKDIEDLAGTFDIIKGQKPTGVEAFSALQLLVERSQSRFTAVFQSRGEMYRQWFSLAIELERQFGPVERTWTVVSPNRGYTFKHFKNAQLQGQILVQIEDGSNMPKTALGKRAAIEQANQLGLLNPGDPDQRYALLQTFGLADLAPSLDFHVQCALQMQEAFERWAETRQGPPPLEVKAWHNPQIHLNERVKWLNTDRMRDLLTAHPDLEPLIAQHLLQLEMMLMIPPTPAGIPNVAAAPPQLPGMPGGPGGPAPGGPGGPGPIGPLPGPTPQGPRGAGALRMSNQISGHPPLPRGTRQMGPNVGPT